MKQSTKLLSLVLALIMAFSCMTVIGNAALVKSEVAYDSIDDAALAPEQVADMALDLVDNDLLAGMDTIELSILGELRLNSIDNIVNDIINLRTTFYWTIGSGLLGSLKDLDFTPLNQDKATNLHVQLGSLVISNTRYPIKRGMGDLYVIGQLLKFLNNNAGTLSSVANGIGTDDGISLGLIGSFLDLGEIGDMLSDIPKMLTELVYDLLVHGSYLEGSTYGDESYPSVEDLNGAALPAPMDNLDDMLNNVLLNLLVNPQEYTREPVFDDEGNKTGEDVKVWDKGSIISPSLKAAAGTTSESRNAMIAKISPLSNSFFTILDNIAQYAIDDVAINALNNNLKKALMEAVEIDLNEINESDLPGFGVDADGNVTAEAGSVAADFQITAKDGEETYVTYIAYDRMAKDGNDYYYTTMGSEPDVDENGDVKTDEETGEELTKKVRKFYKANMTSGNEFASLINWDWKFTDSKTAADTSKGEVQLLYNNIKKEYDGDNTASIVEGINDLLGLVYDVALTDDIKAEFTAFVGNGTGFVKGSNANLMTNINNIAKFILVNYGKLVFGSTSPYAKLTKDEVIDLDTIDLIAMIGPGFFEDVMPQLIIPKYQADAADGSYKKGEYAFHDDVQIYEFGALVIREFMTDIAPNTADMNYDGYIFEEGVDSPNDRQFKELGADQWTNLIINMGVDIGYTYLYNITNFGDTLTYNAGGTYDSGKKGVNVTFRTEEYPELNDDNVYDDSRWSSMLDAAIMWAARYVGGMETSSVLAGFEPSELAKITGDGAASPLNKLSYILNEILPLGFINGFESTTYAFDLYVFFENGLKLFLSDFDLARVLSLLGRNMSQQHYNMLADTNLVNAVLNLVNDILKLVFGEDKPILNGVNATTAGGTQSVKDVISKANLKTTVYNLLTGLYSRKDAILLNALPVVAKLIKGWGTEQAYNTPEITLGNTINLKDGATRNGDNNVVADTISVRNASDGVWRHYVDKDGEHQDNQYQIKLTGVNVYDEMSITSGSKYVTTTLGEQKLVDYGTSTTFQYTVQNVPVTGALVRFEVAYQVYDESGTVMSNGDSFKVSKYVYLNHNESDNNFRDSNDNGNIHAAVYSPQYLPLGSAADMIPTLTTGSFRIEKDSNGSDATFSLTLASGDRTSHGITFGDATASKIGKSNDRSLEVQNFVNDTLYFSDGEGKQSSEKISVAGGFNKDQWESEDFVSGDRTTFAVNLGNGKSTVAKNIVLVYYDEVNFSKLSSLASSELNAMRLEDTYNLNGYYYANSLLVSDNSTDESGETVYRQTNSKATAWIAEKDAGKWYGSYTNSAGTTVTTTATTYDETQVTNRVTIKDKDGNVTSDTGKVGDVDVKKVTVLCADMDKEGNVVGAYVPAFMNGVKEGVGARHLSASNNFDYESLYEALLVSSNDISYFKKPTEQLVDEGMGSSIDAKVAALKDSLKAAEARTTDTHDFTDYKMWRLDRFNEARDDARYFADLYRDNNRALIDVDSRFPYNGMIEADLKGVVAANPDALSQKGGIDNANLVEALLVPMEGDELKAQEEWLENRHNEYGMQQLIDVEMAANALTNTEARLRAKYDVVYDYYLDAEIRSAEAMIGEEIEEDYYEFTDAVKANYTERSWTKFENAYNAAIALYDQEVMTQKQIFDAKYELQCCRNELVLEGEEADYSELEALIAQAEAALHPDNIGMYDNKAEELGMVLAELGVADENGDLIPLYDADGYEVNLFPGSAHYINNEPYSKDEQDVVDQKATELKEALARLKFKGLDIGATEGKDVEIDTGILVEGDEENNIEAVTATIAKIAAEMDAAAVKALFDVKADNAAVGVDNITVSNDLHYTVDTDLEGFAGTNSVVTFYTVVGDVKIPVATVRIVVDGDINGDGAVDGIDAAQAFLVANDFAEIDGCYLLAGDLMNADREVDNSDYGQIINTYFGQNVKTVA